MAGWVVGGDNVKIGDPDFFPDSLSVEISSQTSERARDAAHALIDQLKKQNMRVELRYTDQAFPADFMRIRVAGSL